MDWSSPTQIVFEGGACEPCQWWDRENGLNEEGAEICNCREDCDDDYDIWLENCIKSCDHGVGCIADCYSDALDMQDECYDECGELPEPSDFTWWDLEVFLWWTEGPYQAPTGPPDEYYGRDIVDYPDFPRKIIFPTITDLSSMEVSYCIKYIFHVEHENGLCCNFSQTICQLQ